jgi:alginate O-acetyltransferase complex protein AlgI
MWGKAAVYARLPGPVRVAATFTLVLVSWVFFRASDLGAAWRYLGFMFGAGIDPDAGGSLGGAAFVGGLMDQQYHLTMFVIAAVVTWMCPQTWDWTKTLTWPKAAAVISLFLLSAALLTTQEYNPFIYFIF